MPSRVVKTKATKRNALQEYWHIYENFYRSIDLPLAGTKAVQHNIATNYLPSTYKYALYDYSQLHPDQQQTFRKSGAGGPHRIARKSAAARPPRLTAATKKVLEHAEFWPTAVADGIFPELPGAAPVIPPNDALIPQPLLSNHMTAVGAHVLTHGRRVPGTHANHPALTEVDLLPTAPGIPPANSEWRFVKDLFTTDNRLYFLAIQLWEHRRTLERMVVKHIGYKSSTDKNGNSTRFLEVGANWSHSHANPDFFREAFVGHMLTSRLNMGAMQYVGSVVNRQPTIQCVRIAMQQARYTSLFQFIHARSLAYSQQSNDVLRKFLTDLLKLPRQTMSWRQVEVAVSNQDSEWIHLLRGTSIATGPGRVSLVSNALTATLHAEIRRTSIPEDFIWHVLRLIASTLQTLHSQNYIHGDVKPDNIFLHDALDRDSVAPAMGGWAVETRIGDFGHSHCREDVRRPFVPTGTRGYSAREQRTALVGLNPSSKTLPIVGRAGPKSDVFSLGCVLWQMMDPHICADVVQYLDPTSRQFVEVEELQFDVNMLNTLLPGLYSPTLVNLVRQCLEKHHAARPSAKELLEAYDTYAAGPRIDGPGANHGMADLAEFFCTDICQSLRSECKCRPGHLKFDEWESEFV